MTCCLCCAYLLYIFYCHNIPSLTITHKLLCLLPYIIHACTCLIKYQITCFPAYFKIILSKKPCYPFFKSSSCLWLHLAYISHRINCLIYLITLVHIFFYHNNNKIIRNMFNIIRKLIIRTFQKTGIFHNNKSLLGKERQCFTHINYILNAGIIRIII